MEAEALNRRMRLGAQVTSAWARTRLACVAPSAAVDLVSPYGELRWLTSRRLCRRVRASALVAAELSQHLAKHPPASDERVWIAVPVRRTPAASAAILGIAQSLGLTVDGFVDAAAVTVAAALGVGRSCSRAGAGVFITQPSLLWKAADEARRRSALVSEQGGLIEL